MLVVVCLASAALKDDHEHCRKWADMGECDKNHQAMSAACALSCSTMKSSPDELRKEQVLIDLDPGGLVWTGLDVDDDLALLIAVALNNSKTSTTSLVGLSVCGGNAPLKHTAAGLDLLLHLIGLGADAFPAGISHGAGWQTMRVGWKSLRWMQSISPDVPSSKAAAEAIVAAAVASEPAGLTVISLGPPTNLAAALASAPAIASRLRRVVLMGGEMTGGKMDLNFMSDRGAARAIFEAPVPKMIVPIQLCAQAAMTRARVDALEAACCPGAAACALVRKMALQTSVMPWLVNKHVRPKLPEAGSGHRDAGRWPASGGMEDGFIPWDVVAVLAALRPADLFERWQVHRMTMPRCGDGAEPCDGTMTVEPIDARHITKPLEAPRKFVGYHVPDERGHMLDATTSSDREIHRHVVTVSAAAPLP